MKRLRVLIPLALVAALAVIPAVVQAQKAQGDCPGSGHPMDRGPGPGFGEIGMLHHMLRMSETLGLSEAQEDQIRAILDATEPAVEALTEQMHQARQTWADQNDPAVFDPTAAREFADAQAALQADLMVLGMKNRADVLAVLTSEQLEQLQTMREQRGGRRGHGHKKH